MDHSKTKVNSPQTNGICERFHRTIKDEVYDTTFRKKLYRSVEELQTDLEAWLAKYYNEQRPHSGRYCYVTPYADLPRNVTHRCGQGDQRFRDIGQPKAHSKRRTLRCPSDQVRSFTHSWRRS